MVNTKNLKCAGLAACIVVVALTSGCAQQPVQVQPAPAAPDLIQSAFVVRGEGDAASVRVLTKAAVCPILDIDGKTQAMKVRAPAGTMALRGDPLQGSVKQAEFPILSCDADLPKGALHARVGAIVLPVPRAAIRRIAIIADTGCRMKAADNAFQACNDAQKWPFAQVAKSSAALNPDLVIHIGDIHYREAPCPAGNAGCANSPWGYGYDAWEADLFEPARPLLMAAPWLFVRGNHESCSRAGQGWFRFLDSKPWTEGRSCNTPKLDADADFTDPFAVPIGHDTHLIVFDSSKAGSKAYTSRDEGYKRYIPQLLQAGKLAKQAPHSFFMNHHPLLGFAPGKEGIKPGSESLQSVMSLVYPERLFPPGVDVALHGHVHLFESLSFAGGYPATFVMGNSGSASEGGLPEILPAGSQPFPGAVIENFATRSAYGFATLDRVGNEWQLTERDVQGRPIFLCDMRTAKSVCRKIGNDQ